ncbi:hypothetical protein [Mesorhizobium sp. LjNodule214]|uniref:hypothetical protein n=1 Tax=Mesorhizobium sp. LjNodule214 TaxID=3342252 RepID=UPI003ED0EBD9
MANEMQITMAFGSKESAGTAALAAVFMERFTGEAASVEMLRGLAGPNDTFQLIMRWKGWLAFAAIVGPFWAQYSGSAGTDAWEKTKVLYEEWSGTNNSVQDASGFTALFEMLKQARKDGISIIFALRMNSENFKGRNIGIELTDVSPETIARAIAVLARSGEAITRALEEQGFKEADVENSDCSGAITVHADGSAEISVFSGRGSDTLLLKFDASGKRVE